MIDQVPLVARQRHIRNNYAQGAVFGLRQGTGAQPGRLALDRYRRAGAQFGDKGLHVPWIGQTPALRRLVQGNGEGGIAGGGDGGCGVKNFAQAPGQIVAAMMAAQ